MVLKSSLRWGVLWLWEAWPSKARLSRDEGQGGICHACDGSEANDYHVEMSVGWNDSVMTNLHRDGDGSRDGLRQKGSVMAIWRWK